MRLNTKIWIRITAPRYLADRLAWLPQFDTTAGRHS